MNRHTLTVLLLITFSACSRTKEEQKETPPVDSAAAARSSLPGLWSLDNQEQLTDTGFLLSAEGTLETIGTVHTGDWYVSGEDSIVLHFSDDSGKEISATYRIIALTAERMLLAGPSGNRLYRKVPFGMASEPEVLSGFAGSLTDRQQEKTHSLLLPATRKIGLRLTAADTTLRAELYRGEKSMSPEGIREWDGILVRGGNDFRIRIFSTRPDALRPEGSGYDVRILSY